MTNLSNETYRSPKTLGYLAMGGLALVGLAEFLSVLVGFGQIMSPSSTIEGNQPMWILLQGVVALLQFPCYILTVVFFLIWLNRANKNLTPLGANNLEFSSGWAVGWWFIPFANLVKPFQVVREVWNESDPDVDPNYSFLSSSMGTPPLLGFWWAFWIISNIAANISSRMLEVETPKDLEVSGYVFIVSGILMVVAAILAIKVVYGITSRQEERILKVGSLRQNFQPPPAPPKFD
jgi:hypothetical protein